MLVPPAEEKQLAMKQIHPRPDTGILQVPTRTRTSERTREEEESEKNHKEPPTRKKKHAAGKQKKQEETFT